MKLNKIIQTTCFGLAVFFNLPHVASAQVYSGNVVGYINKVLFAGDNLIANQLIAGDNTLTGLFSNNVPQGASFTKWNSASQTYLPFSTYDTSSGWSINYDLNLGEGGLFRSPSAFTNTFVGTVWSGFGGINGDPYNPPLFTGTGKFLLSSYIPITASFYSIVGRNPLNGESVTVLDGASQVESVTTFQGGIWDNGDPLLTVGQAAFFSLGESASAVPAVPEPATCTLLGSGMAALVGRRFFRRK